MKKYLQLGIAIVAWVAMITVISCLLLGGNSKAAAASIVQQQGNIFNSPTQVDNKVKITFKSGVTVKYIRHTKYLEDDFVLKSAFKQMKATTKFTAFAYNCPGYYITRAYSDSNGSNLIGYIYVYVAPNDVQNGACEPLSSTGTKTVTQPINATHPIATVKEKSKMVAPTKTVTPSQPVTITQPTVIKNSDLTETVEPTDAEMQAFFAQQDNHDACLDGTNKGVPKYMSKDGGVTFECVDYGECLLTYEHAQKYWYCKESVIDFKNVSEPTASTVYYDIPEYNNYNVATNCDGDAAATEECGQMEYLDHTNLPNGQTEPASTYVEETEPTTPEEVMQIRACKEEHTAYGILFDGVYQMPREYTQNDVYVSTANSSNVNTFVDYNNRLSLTFKEGTPFTLQVGNSTVLNELAFANAAPCPSVGEESGGGSTTSPVADGLYIKACRVDSTTNQFELSMSSKQFGDEAEIPFLNRGNTWVQYPNETNDLRVTPSGNKAILTLDTNMSHDFAFEAYREVGGTEYQSNVLTAAQILESSECSTTGNIEVPGEELGDAPNCEADPFATPCLPSCYCPNLDNYGAGLGFMCCVWDCPGLDSIVSDFKDFLTDDVVGTATAPEVPQFEQGKPPNIFDILNNVDTRNMPDAPTGQNAPGLENAGFTAEDVKKAAPEIQFNEDTTGGFKINDPLSTLPEGKDAPRPKDATVTSPDLTGGSGSLNGTATPPKLNSSTATPPTTNSTTPTPNTGGTATPPTEYGK